MAAVAAEALQLQQQQLSRTAQAVPAVSKVHVLSCDSKAFGCSSDDWSRRLINRVRSYSSSYSSGYSSTDACSLDLLCSMLGGGFRAVWQGVWGRACSAVVCRPGMVWLLGLDVPAGLWLLCCRPC
jgi:hypothetical protein